jgi:hypothetical protein
VPNPAPRGKIPYRLLAALFVPAALVYVWLFRGLITFRFAHPLLLAAVPVVLLLALWLGIRRARPAFLVHSRASELGAQRAGLIAATCPWHCDCSPSPCSA